MAGRVESVGRNESGFSLGMRYSGIYPIAALAVMPNMYLFLKMIGPETVQYIV